MAELSTLGGVIKAAYQAEEGAMLDADKEKLDLYPASVGTAGQVLKNVAGTLQFAADTNTTYTAMTQAEAEAASVGTARTISSVVLKAAIEAHSPSAGAVADAVDETDVVAQFNALLASLRVAGILTT